MVVPTEGVEGAELDCFQGGVIPCQASVRCQGRLVGMMLEERAEIS